MANYPQLDNASGVWNLREVYDAVMGGYWPNANSIGLFSGGFNPGSVSTINKITISTTFILPSLFKSPKLELLSPSKTTLTSSTTSIIFAISSSFKSPKTSCSSVSVSYTHLTLPTKRIV